MAAVAEISDFIKDKKTKRGAPLAVKPELVTAVASWAIDDVIGARSYGERVVHLRRCRAEGRLISNPGRLQQSLRRRSHGVRRAYVFRGPASHVPRIKREPRERTRPAGGVGRVIEV